jgi:bile acid:Na+ symporter, BASS family
MTPALIVILKLAVSGMIFAVGLGSRPADVVAILRQPGLLARSLFAIYVAVPAVVVAGAWLLPLPDGFRVGLLVLAASGGAPLLPSRLTALGNQTYVFGLVAISALVAIVVVPLWLQLLGPLFNNTRVLTSWQIARVLAVSFLLPLAAGMAIGWIWKERSAAWSKSILSAMGLLLAASALLLMALNLGVLLAAGWLALATLVLFSVAALAVGHLMGGPAPADRAALAVICATRHLGILALLAASVPGPRTLVLMLAYVLAAMLVTVPYVAWMRRRHGLEAKQA